jgi:hypothetical protein
MKHSIHIEAPVDTTFNFMLGLFKDPAKWPELFSGVVADDVKATEDGVGTYISWHTRLAGIPAQGFDVLTDVVPHEHITERSSNALVGTWDYDFEPEGSGTKLTLEQHPSSFWRLPPLHNLMEMARRGQLDTFMTRLKDELETASS